MKKTENYTNEAAAAGVDLHNVPNQRSYIYKNHQNVNLKQQLNKG